MTTKTEMPELKPCPFCGGHAEIFIDRLCGHCVQCVDCGSSTDYYHGDRGNYTETANKKVAQSWNTRADLVEQPADANTQAALEWFNKVIDGNIEESYPDEVKAIRKALDALHTYDPATHVVVPREPTEKMLKVGFDFIMGCKSPREIGWKTYVRDLHKAMIAVAEGE